MPKFETHLHTAECDKYAFVKARDAVRMYKEAGYDGMVVTDHYFDRFHVGLQTSCTVLIIRVLFKDGFADTTAQEKKAKKSDLPFFRVPR